MVLRSAHGGQASPGSVPSQGSRGRASRCRRQLASSSDTNGWHLLPTQPVRIQQRWLLAELIDAPVTDTAKLQYFSLKVHDLLFKFLTEYKKNILFIMQ